MFRRRRTGFASLVMFAALSVVLIGGSAPSVALGTEYAWKVAGATLKSSEKKELSPTVKVVEALTIAQQGGVTIVCNEAVSKGSYLEGLAGGRIGFEFTKCEVTSAPSECQVAEPVKFQLLTLTLKGVEALAIELTPITGGEVVSLTIKAQTGKTCGAAGVLKITGKIEGNLPEGETEKLTHNVQFTETSGSALKGNGKAVGFLLVAGLSLLAVAVFASVAR